jgi:hypothetical protein
LALQRGLGLLPERRIGFGVADRRDIGANGSPLAPLSSAHAVRHRPAESVLPSPQPSVSAQHPSERMAYENTVLSLNPDRETLLRYETALRESGFEVISVSAPLDARFEIEMGRCGIFLTSYLTSLAIYRDLASLFRRSCPDGRIIFFMDRPHDNAPDADILVSDGDEPRSLVERIRSKQQTKAS